jgi:hypothetical protein
VDQAELDNALEELEIRMERLRALYEQYFMGIEKIEPTVARKDVDRRVWMLRKEQIRNTGKRFKLNVLIQRYNTFQQYWTRICREIENGTYSRHLARMKRIGEEPALLTIQARRRAGLFARGHEDAEADGSGADEAAAETSPPDSLTPSLDPLDELRQAMDEAFGKSDVPPTGGDLEARQSQPEVIPRAPKVPGPGRGLTAFDLDLDDEALQARRPPPPGASDSPSRGPVPPGLHAPSVPPAPPLATRTPGPSARPLPPPLSRLSQTQRSDGNEAEPPPPAFRAPPPRPVPPRPAAPRPPADPPGLSEQRVRELHAKLIEAKRSMNDTGNVSEETLTRSLRAAEAKLRTQHGAERRIDFDVIIKDGKAVLKPVVR